MATLKTGWVKKIIDGVSTKIFAISHVKSTYYDYTNGKTLKSKLDDMDKSISGKSEKDHTHSYAGSDSVGGAATSAKECTGNSATATKATQDSDGNIIKSTYSKVGHKHTKSEITDFPSSLKNPNTLSINGKTYDGSSAVDVGTIGASYGGTGKTSLGDSANVLINALSTGSDTPKDGDYYVSQYVNGGTSTTTYHRRPMSALWNYIKSKLSTVATSGSYNDLSNKPTIGNGTVTIKQAGTSKGSFTMNQSGNTTIELTDNNTTYSTATQSANGLMSSSDKTKLDGIATGANKTTVDSALSSSSTNPVQNKVVNSALAGKASSSHTHSNYASKSVYGDTTVSMGRKSGTTVGDNSFAFGVSAEATGPYSLSIGNTTSATGDYSVALSSATRSTNLASFAANHNTQATGSCSASFGNGTVALTNQFVIGHLNNTSNASDNSIVGASSGTAFVIGNGSSSSSLSNALRVTGKGQIYSPLTTILAGADYAEYFEWADENQDKEDRVGYFVTFDENNPEKIRIANEDDYILGIVSGIPSVIGNGDEDWKKRYILDDFGRYIEETFEYEEKVIIGHKKDGEPITETVTKTGTKWKENPEYDNTIEYIPRDERAEWSAIGMLGVLSVYEDGTCQVNGYCRCTNGGIATATEERSGYRVIKRVTDNIVKIVLK